jgi:hypothetical protein
MGSSKPGRWLFEVFAATQLNFHVIFAMYSLARVAETLGLRDGCAYSLTNAGHELQPKAHKFFQRRTFLGAELFFG